MNLLWLLLIPTGIFTACSLGVSFFRLSEHYGWEHQWWHFPAWMVFGMCVIVPVLAGSIMGGLFMAFA